MGYSKWTAIVVSTAVNEPFSVIAADFDGDGWLDLASASWWDHKIAWCKCMQFVVLVQT